MIPANVHTYIKACQQSMEITLFVIVVASVVVLIMSEHKLHSADYTENFQQWKDKSTHNWNKWCSILSEYEEGFRKKKSTKIVLESWHQKLPALYLSN